MIRANIKTKGQIWPIFKNRHDIAVSGTSKVGMVLTSVELIECGFIVDSYMILGFSQS